MFGLYDDVHRHKMKREERNRPISGDDDCLPRYVFSIPNAGQGLV